MDSGKRFEARFAKSLHRLPGASMRIEDGGARAKNYQFGDFLYWDYDGGDWLIECKATREKSFPMSQLRDEQMAKLRTFDRLSQNRHAVIALNFWDEPYRTNNECVLVAFNVYELLCERAKEQGRASIPRAWLEACGKLQPAENGAWALDFGGLKNG